MDQQQYPTGAPEQSGVPVPTQPVPTARLEPIGENWAQGVGPVRLSSRSSRFRWAIALGIVMIVALVTVGGAFVLSGAGGAAKSLTAGNAPKDTLLFVDVRTDLPGDQHQKLADFMSHFPGFKDRAQFDTAFDDVLNRITESISPDFRYTSAFKGWTAGELSIAILSMGSVAGPSANVDQIMAAVASGLGETAPNTAASGTPESGAVIVALKDRAAGEAWVSAEVAKAGMTFTAQDYAGTKLYVSTKPDSSGRITAAYAFTDKVLLLGTVEAVKAGLDAPAKGSLTDNDGYKAAVQSLSGDAIASFYVNPQAYAQQMIGPMAGLAGMSSTGMMLSLDSLPTWMAGSVRAESGYMTLEMTMPKSPKALTQGNKVSVIAPELPGSTVGVVELHSVGKLVNDELAAMAALPGSSSTASLTDGIKQIRDALTRIGGIDWIGDADAVVTRSGSTYSGGLVVKTPDAATATAKKAMITNLIALAGTSMGITSTDATYKGTTITTVAIANGAAPVRIGIATKGDLLVAGYGDDFVKAVIDTTAADSLASQSDFKTVMAAVGASNMGSGYFNISAVADEIGKAALAGNAASYNLNYKPYIDHIGGTAFAGIDGTTVTMRLVFTAK